MATKMRDLPEYWSDIDDLTLLALWNSGANATSIVEHFGNRTKNSVIGRLYRLRTKGANTVQHGNFAGKRKLSSCAYKSILASSKTYRQLAEKYHVHVSTIGEIKRMGKTGDL
ncbi:MAG: hypothetical protein KGL39_18010 [Patescibacteria group bacterium]|nr:hypothetical protein [Patescibacteria group bacterium]